ncbi:MAG: hypothetical protein K2F81_03035, partial [Ruminococcus sp.]|nr:hypothetical protein [Ruminococcus sp.]
FIVLIYDNDVNIHMEVCESKLLFMISSLIGIALLVNIAKRLGDHGKVLTYVGRNSLIYYAFQSKAIKVSYFALRIIPFTLSTYISSIIVLCMSAVILIAPTFIINKYFPFMLGRPYKLKSK